MVKCGWEMAEEDAKVKPPEEAKEARWRVEVRSEEEEADEAAEWVVDWEVRGRSDGGCEEEPRLSREREGRDTSFVSTWNGQELKVK